MLIGNLPTANYGQYDILSTLVSNEFSHEVERLLKLLFPVLDEASESYHLGVFSVANRFQAPLESESPYEDCLVMFGAEQSAAVEERYMRSNVPGLSPYGFKIWEDRINAFRAVASVNSFELSLAESDQISQGVGYQRLSSHERSIVSYAYLGLSAAETSRAMHRSIATVNAHRRSVVMKLGCALTPIVLARVVYAHKAVKEMCGLKPENTPGKHYTVSKYPKSSDLPQTTA